MLQPTQKFKVCYLCSIATFGSLAHNFSILLMVSSLKTCRPERTFFSAGRGSIEPMDKGKCTKTVLVGHSSSDTQARRQLLMTCPKQLSMSKVPPSL